MIRRNGGFALVSTLALMILLVVVAVGLLQLSAVSLRCADQEKWVAQARANARVALKLAVGQLQMELGPDRRISAQAGILDGSPASASIEGVANPYWTGVWNAAESPFTKWTLDRPSYDKKSVFRNWLVSGNPDEIKLLDAATAPSSGNGSLCQLLPEDPSGKTRRGVSVPVLSGPGSSFAWWTSDNGVKATLRPGQAPDAKSRSEALVNLRRGDANGHAAIDDKLPNRGNGLDSRLVDLGTADAATAGLTGENRVSWKYLHDLTTASETVPVDVTTGSLRKCMNLYLDWLQAQTPAARAAAGTIGKMRSPTMDCRLFSWDQLRNYESIARSGSMLRVNPSTGRPVVRTYFQSGSNPEPEWNPGMSEDRFRIQPVLLKLSYVVSYSTEKVDNPSDPAKSYALRLYLYPIAVLWNPYNVDLEVPEYCASGICPLIFDVNKGTTTATKVDLTKKNTATRLAFGPEMGGAQKFTNLLIPAGSTKVLYPQPVRWQTYPDEHRYKPKAPYEYYMWAQTQKFDLGDSNYGGVLKNLKGNADSFTSNPSQEILGAGNDVIRMAVTPAGSDGMIRFAVDGAHTDWWGNNGPGQDSQDTLQKFGTSTAVSFSVESTSPQISTIAEKDVPARTFAQLENRPTPLLLFEFYRKAADEDLFPNKMGSFSVAGNPAQGSTSSSLGGGDLVTPWFESAYSFRFKSISSWFDVTKTFQLPPDRDDCIYFGASYSPRGQLSVIDQEIPLSPMVSLASLQHLPMFDYRPTYDPAMRNFTTVWYKGDYWFYLGRVIQFGQNHAIGNSFASPGIPSDKLVQPGWRTSFSYGDFDNLRVDRSYMANAVLWDSWFCSTLAAQDGLMLTRDGTKRSARQVAQELFGSGNPPPEDAIAPRPTRGAAELLSSLFSANGSPAKDAYQKIAEHVRIEGGFNVNSTSEEAWTHFLCGLLSRPHLVMESRTGAEAPTVVEPETGKFLIARHSLSNAPPAERASGADRENRYWNGSREVTAAQIRELAAAIVVQVKKRGPFLSLAEFVNRRLSRDAELSSSGALQSALDDSSVSINQVFRSDVLSGSERVSSGKPNYAFAAAAKGPKRQGITGYVTQADLLESLGPFITPRSDTFTIRTMGEAKDDKGNVRARAWCEAVVQRAAKYVDPADDATVADTALKQPVNKLFGRRFEVSSFRWLDPKELKNPS